MDREELLHTNLYNITVALESIAESLKKIVDKPVVPPVNIPGVTPSDIKYGQDFGKFLEDLAMTMNKTMEAQLQKQYCRLCKRQLSTDKDGLCEVCANIKQNLTE